MMIEVSSPPDYARTTFLILLLSIFVISVYIYSCRSAFMRLLYNRLSRLSRPFSDIFSSFYIYSAYSPVFAYYSSGGENRCISFVKTARIADESARIAARRFAGRRVVAFRTPHLSLHDIFPSRGRLGTTFSKAKRSFSVPLLKPQNGVATRRGSPTRTQ